MNFGMLLENMTRRKVTMTDPKTIFEYDPDTDTVHVYQSSLYDHPDDGELPNGDLDSRCRNVQVDKNVPIGKRVE